MVFWLLGLVQKHYCDVIVGKQIDETRDIALYCLAKIQFHMIKTPTRSKYIYFVRQVIATEQTKA